MILLDKLQETSRREKLAIGVSALFFLSLIGVAPYLSKTLVLKTLLGGIVGLVIADLRAGNICSNFKTGVNQMIKFWSLALAVVIFGWLTVAIAQVLR